ncbi:hypothetical protein [Bradyrhizobium australiense]|uniref:Uncharacterized protein n=1 Tax=Bradyrhizobium australiense TaxID=2721161 RepID=A0A7Y4GQ87_9BRAD|nr:hypothetical protein [Bradyrhizobium australiense]NOJ39985.1 hypothetical protein [Bradyrhizobium australiense]
MRMLGGLLEQLPQSSDAFWCAFSMRSIKMRRIHLVLLLTCFCYPAMTAAPSAFAGEFWIGTAPFCSASPQDCTQRGFDFVRSDKKGDGKRCVTGKKVLCACTAPVLRQFYIIAHRTNALDKVRAALRQGANGIEIDVRYRRREQGFCANHDSFDPSCNRLVPFLRELNAIASNSKQLALIVLDFKNHDGNQNAFRELLDIVRRELTSNLGLKMILSTGSLALARRVMPNAGALRRGEAFSIDEEDDPDAVANFLAGTVSGEGSKAYGNGTFEPGIEVHIQNSIQRAVSLRRQGQFQFVYVWTLARTASMRDYLRIGVDGILVNDPRKLRDVITLAEHDPSSCFNVRLETRADSVPAPAPATTPTPIPTPEPPSSCGPGRPCGQGRACCEVGDRMVCQPPGTSCR